MAKSERSSLSILIVSILLGAIFLRLFFIQIINGDEYNQLASILENAEIVSMDEAGDGKVSLGVIVSLLYQGDSEPEKMLVGSIEEQREDVEVLSPDSPLGEALIGASVGDAVTFEAPNGDLTVKVVAIEK